MFAPAGYTSTPQARSPAATNNGLGRPRAWGRDGAAGRSARHTRGRPQRTRHPRPRRERSALCATRPRPLAFRSTAVVRVRRRQRQPREPVEHLPKGRHVRRPLERRSALAVVDGESDTATMSPLSRAEPLRHDPAALHQRAVGHPLPRALLDPAGTMTPHLLVRHLEISGCAGARRNDDHVSIHHAAPAPTLGPACADRAQVHCGQTVSRSNPASQTNAGWLSTCSRSKTTSTSISSPPAIASTYPIGSSISTGGRTV